MPANQLVFGLYAVADTLYIFDTDALTFTEVNTPMSLALATNGVGDYVSVRSGAAPSDDQAWQSTDDAATWAAVGTGTANGSGYVVRWNKFYDKFYAVDLSASITWTSPDGATWTAVGAAPVGGVTYYTFKDLIVIGANLYTIGVIAIGSQFKGTNIFQGYTNHVWGDTARNAVGLSLDCYGNGTTVPYMPRAIVTNRDLIVALSGIVSDGSWSSWTGEDTGPSAFTQCTFSGDGAALRCAAASPDGYWIAGGNQTWSHSADGKAWVGVGGEPELAGWWLNDCLFDGAIFWFTGTDGTTPAVFSYDPTPTYSTGSWTRYEAGGTPGMAWQVTGYPSYWDFVPYPVEGPGVVNVLADDVQAPVFVDSAVVNVVADSAAYLAQVEGSAVVNVFAEDAFPYLIRVAIVEEWITPG